MPTTLKKILKCLSLREDDTSSIHIVKQSQLKNTVQNDLVFIAANYSVLPDEIKCHKERNKTIVNSSDVINNSKCFQMLQVKL